MKNILLTFEYDGTRFCGWQRQPNVRTVQGVLEETLTRLCREPITLDGVSRTDARVHALASRATFQTSSAIPAERVALALNRALRGRSPGDSANGDIRILSAVEMPEGFHARYDAKGKTYRYMIRNAADMPVFLRNYRYLVENSLDVSRMRAAADHIVGTHDFACFQATGSNPRLTTVRTVKSLTVSEIPVYGDPAWDSIGEASGEVSSPASFPPKDVVIEITGDGFLYNMVRIIAGTLVECGMGKRSADSLVWTIDSLDRSKAGHTAPPQGLYLAKVYY